MMDFVAIDFETANEKRASACAVGFTIVRNGEIVESFSRLIRPLELRFAYQNTCIHGLTESDVAGAPTLVELWPELLPLIDEQVVVAHNASFDMSVLRHSLHAASIPTPRLTYLCSVQVARCVWPRLVSHSLGFLADSLGIPLTHHDAGSDSNASAEVIIRALQATQSTSILDLANTLKIRLGELYSAEEWIPSTAPSLRASRDTIEIEIPEDFDVTSHELYNQDVAFTGTLRFFSRKEAFRIVKQFGGYPSESVNRSTSYLITGNQDARMLAIGSTESSKLQKAKSLRDSGYDVMIITEDEFYQMILSPTKLGSE